MKTLHIRDLLPVDLNSILYKYETNLVEFFKDVRGSTYLPELSLLTSKTNRL